MVVEVVAVAACVLAVGAHAAKVAPGSEAAAEVEVVVECVADHTPVAGASGEGMYPVAAGEGMYPVAGTPGEGMYPVAGMPPGEHVDTLVEGGQGLNTQVV